MIATAPPVTQYETRVSVYPEPTDYVKDAAKAAAEGWSVVSVVRWQSRASRLGAIFFGWYRLVRPKHVNLIVTYVRPRTNTSAE